MKYKIGDKVVIVLWEGLMEEGDDITPDVGKVGRITRIIKEHNHPYQIAFEPCTGHCVDSRHGGCNCEDNSFFEEELEFAIQPGEQLLFSFMEKY